MAERPVFLGSSPPYTGLELQASKPFRPGAMDGDGNSVLNGLTLTNVPVQANLNRVSFYGFYQPSSQWSFQGLLGYGNFNLHILRVIAFVSTTTLITAIVIAKAFTAASQG
jgi:hypothetical protein